MPVDDRDFSSYPNNARGNYERIPVEFNTRGAPRLSPCRVGDGHNPKLSRQPMYGVEPCIFALDCSDGRDVPPAGEVRWMAILPGWNLEW